MIKMDDIPADFAFFKRPTGWKASFDFKLPDFEEPHWENKDPLEIQSFLFDNPHDMIVPYGTALQHNTFYYHGDSQHLFYIEPRHGFFPPKPPGEENWHDWYSLKNIWIPHTEGLETTFSETLNLANYDRYTTYMDKNLITKEELLTHLGENIEWPAVLLKEETFPLNKEDVFNFSLSGESTAVPFLEKSAQPSMVASGNPFCEQGIDILMVALNESIL